MKTSRDLRYMLDGIDRAGYPAYKRLRGCYAFEGFELSVDHVQGDPFAAPSDMSVYLRHRDAAWPDDLFGTRWRRTAFEDFLIRRFARALNRYSFKATGSGKSGCLETSRPGPEVVERSACTVGEEGFELRFRAGLPARGRSVDASQLARMLFDFVPRAVDEALVCRERDLAAARAVAELADDQHALRSELDRLGLVAFVADGSVLPRASGVSSRPMENALPFRSPDSLRVAVELPHRGTVFGMGIRRGVTLVVGGGYHGKSTLLQALQEGVYDHVAGDGREYVACDATAMKLRAEDGRAVHAVDISMFIGDLPNKVDTARFSTLDASGSTSQAASTVEALECGARALLIDEDTSATNFMVRDELMEAVVSREHEPITPFVERVRDLWERAGVSSVIVAGSSGAFFGVADTVVQMDCYEPLDITERVRRVCAERAVAPVRHAPDFSLPQERPGLALAGGGRAPRPGRDERVKVRAGLDSIQVGRGGCDVRLVEQLVDAEQAAALAQMVRLAFERGLLDGGRGVAQVASRVFDELACDGLDALSPHGSAGCGLAMPRLQELCCVLNRWRG